MNSVKASVSWVMGAFLFVGLIVYSALESLAFPFRKRSKLAALHHFRAHELQLLDVVHDEMAMVKIHLGNLPKSIGDTCQFQVPALHSQHREVLLKAQLISSFSSTLELAFVIHTHDSSACREHFYFFKNSLTEDGLPSYEAALVWFRIPADGIFWVTLEDVQTDGASRNFEGSLAVVGYRINQ